MESPSTTSLQPKSWQKLIEGHKAGVNKQKNNELQAGTLGITQPQPIYQRDAVNFMEYL